MLPAGRCEEPEEVRLPHLHRAEGAAWRPGRRHRPDQAHQVSALWAWQSPTCMLDPAPVWWRSDPVCMCKTLTPEGVPDFLRRRPSRNRHQTQQGCLQRKGLGAGRCSIRLQPALPDDMRTGGHAHVTLACGARRRVERRQLAALVEDGSALPCVMPEIDVIAKIVTYYNRWQVCGL